MALPSNSNYSSQPTQEVSTVTILPILQIVKLR